MAVSASSIQQIILCLRRLPLIIIIATIGVGGLGGALVAPLITRRFGQGTTLLISVYMVTAIMERLRARTGDVRRLNADLAEQYLDPAAITLVEGGVETAKALLEQRWGETGDVEAFRHDEARVVEFAGDPR